MVKSKKQDPDEEELEEESEEEVPTKKRKSEPATETSKKAKTAAKPGSKAAGEGASIGTKQVTSDGRPCVNVGPAAGYCGTSYGYWKLIHSKLSEYKRVTINEFKGAMLIDIRETYKDKSSGDMKPGKKGISLTLDQWKALKDSIALIDELLEGE